MPRYYCDYCDTYLTHDSPSVRKQHNAGYKHKANVRTYYQQFEEQQTQSLIDQRIKEHLSGQAAFGIGNQFAAWRPGIRPPIFPPPLPIPGGAPMAPIPRLAVMPRPMGVPVYGTAPMSAPGAGQPGAPGGPIQPNGLPGPPPMPAPTSAPGPQPTYQNPGPNAAPSMAPPGSNGAPPTGPPPGFQNPAASGNFSGTSMPSASTFPSSGGNATYPTTSGADSFAYPQAPNSGR
ncbi:hypothetical protein RND81_07G105400 [Saponaria officinalis]|uniref:U1 small nuclear ribonucleoprotein C n=1 Tax=Saponaria officinalis TaxID=3572 RepID=A0AAW1JTS0_SAPOF